MNKNLIAFSLAALLVAACEPTPRVRPPKPELTTPEQQTTETTPVPPAGIPTEVTPTEVTVTPMPPAEQAAPAVDYAASLLSVGSTRVDYNLLRPWEKTNATTGRAMGVHIGNGQVLTVAAPLRSATYVELTLPDKSATVTGKVLRCDYDLNLALVTVADEKDMTIFETRTACEVGEPLKVDDKADLWTILRGTIPTSVQLAVLNGMESNSMPALNLKAAAPVTDGATPGLPIIRDGKLVGLLTNYQSSSLAVTCLNADLIARFLSSSTDCEFGAPSLGLAFTVLDDPVFRRYLKLPEGQDGLYISKVMPNSAAEKAGLKDGDVLTAVDGLTLDSQARCQHPIYGLLDARVLLRALKPIGQTMELTISRAGETMVIPVELNRDAVEKALIGEQLPGVAPRYLIHGGLTFQPLTRQYMTALQRQANGALPVEFLQLEARTPDLLAEGRKELVTLSLIMPTAATLGYENLGFCVVEKVNGKPFADFAGFVALVDEQTENGITEFSINKPPYTIYMDAKETEQVNETIRRTIPQLRLTE